MEGKLITLSQLRKKLQTQTCLKCGTKKGRNGGIDFEIIPAPDFLSKLNCVTNYQTPDTKHTTEKARKSLEFEISTPPTPKS